MIWSKFKLLEDKSMSHLKTLLINTYYVPDSPIDMVNSLYSNQNGHVALNDDTCRQDYDMI